MILISFIIFIILAIWIYKILYNKTSVDCWIDEHMFIVILIMIGIIFITGIIYTFNYDTNYKYAPECYLGFKYYKIIINGETDWCNYNYFGLIDCESGNKYKKISSLKITNESKCIGGRKWEE